MEVLERINYKGVEIRVSFDDDPALNPRLDDCFGTIVDKVSRYELGDAGSYIEKSDLVEGKDCVLPLYIYDHSGITISTTPFGCQWDSGLIGYVYVTEDRIKEEFGVEEVSTDLRKQAMKILRSEVEIYDKFIRGEMYWYDSDISSCGGYFDMESMIDDAKSEIDHYIKRKRVEHFNKMKAWIKNKVGLEYRTPLPIV